MARLPRGAPQNQERLEKIKIIKIELCNAIRQAMIRRGWSQKYLAWYLGTSEACISRVIRRRTNQITFNQLFSYLVLIEPEFRLLIAI